jgi:hypothetical protein
MLPRTSGADVLAPRRRRRALVAYLVLGIAAPAAFAEETAPEPPPKPLGRISVERIGPAEPPDVTEAAHGQKRLLTEARVGDRVVIQLLDTTFAKVKDQKVMISFTNRDATFPVGWAKWKTDGVQENDFPTLQLSVPQRVLRDPVQPEWVNVEVHVGDSKSTDGAGLTSSAGMHVFPRTRVALETINGRRAKSEPPAAIEWTHQIRVTGSGFVAPDRRIEFRVNKILFPVEDVDPEGRSFVVQLPQDGRGGMDGLSNIGRKDVSLTVWDDTVDLGGFDTVQVEDGTTLTLKRKWFAAILSMIPLAALGALIGLACYRVQSNRTYALWTPTHGSDSQPRRSSRYRTRPTYFKSFEVLLLDPATNTYSLSRFQFLWWLGILLFSYSYLFVARGMYVAQDWCFYDLSGSAYPLLISLGTLVGATWTTRIVGPKGSGDDHPALTDLFVHGGVIALDRVQQLAISVIAGVMFIWIVWRTAPSTATLPDVPERLLTLMGFSSAGYLGGKFARKAGPIVDHADVSESDDAAVKKTAADAKGAAAATSAGKCKVLRIWGAYLSIRAEVFVNKARVDPEAVVPGDRSDAGSDFTDVLRIALGRLPAEIQGSELKSIVVVNGDAQEARWAAPDPEEEKPSTL